MYDSRVKAHPSGRSATRPGPSCPDAGCVCILNTASGSGSAGKDRDRIEAILAERNCTARIVTPADGDIVEMAKAAVRAGTRSIIAAGGDGTVNAVANAVTGTDAALAVLPLGTLNHFAKDAGIPLDLREAILAALEGVVRTVDAAEVNGRVFVNNSSIGLYPHIVREREALQRQGHGKWVSLARAMLGVFHHAPGPRLDLRFAHRALKGRSELVFVGNNQYELAAARIGARASLDSGVLWVYRVPHAGRFRAIAAAIAAFFGGGSPKAPLAFSTAELRIHARAHELEVALDGEVVRMRTPLHYRSRPGALRVMVPAPAPSDA